MCPDTRVMKEVPHAHGEHFVCSDTALIEQENLFPKTNAAVKIFKLTFLLLGNRDSLQEVQPKDSSFYFFRKEWCY